MGDFSNYYRTTRMTFQAFGLWPFQKFSTRMIILTLVLFDLASITVPMVWYFLEEFSNTSEMIHCLPALSMLYEAYLSLFTRIVNMNKIKNIFNCMRIAWEHLTNTDEKVIFTRYARKGQIMATSLFGLGIVAGLAFTSLPWISKGLDSIIAPNESHAMENILRVNFYNMNPKEHYSLINLYSFQVCYVIIILSIMYGIYFPQVIHHACSMFAVLSHKIENVSRMNSELRNEMSNSEVDKVLSMEINTCICYHQECISFCQLIDDSVKYLWLMRFFVDASMVTVMGVQTIVTLGKPIHLISNALNTTGVIVLLFCTTWTSQQVLGHSNQLSESIYDINWYEFPPRSKKLIHIMLFRSYKPCTLTAGGMIDLNLETFCRFMKLSASYFTLVLSTQ